MLLAGQSLTARLALDSLGACPTHSSSLRPRVPRRRGALPRGGARRGDVRHPVGARADPQAAWAARTGRSRRSGEGSSSARWPSSTTSRARRRRVVLEDAKCLVIDAATLEQMIATQHRDRDAPGEEARAPPRLGRRDDPDPAQPRPARRACCWRSSATPRRSASDDRGLGVRVHRRPPIWRARWASTATQVRDVLARLRAPAHRGGGRGGGRSSSIDLPRLHGVHRVPRDAAKGSRARAATVDLRVIGCHGGETPKHRTSAFVARRPHRHRRRLADERHGARGAVRARGRARSATRTSTTCATWRPSPTTAARTAPRRSSSPGTKRTIAILKKHFFNDLLWPDFSKIPDAATAGHPLPRAQAGEADDDRRLRGPRHPGEPHHRDAARFIDRAARTASLGVQRRHGPDRPPLGGAERDRRTSRRCSWK